MVAILHVWTQDNLRLQGVHYEANNKDTCVLLIHGMSGNFIENYFADILGEELQKQGFGYIYAHNRGYSHINDIVINEVDDHNAYKTDVSGLCTSDLKKVSSTLMYGLRKLYA